jgi:hypothetical protein
VRPRTHITSVVRLGAATLALGIAATATPAGAQAPGTVGFTTYTPPGRFVALDDPELFGAEPSIGATHATTAFPNGNLFVQGYEVTMRGTVDDSASPPVVTWKDVSSPLAGHDTASADPILYVDQHTNRIFNSQLESACSVQAYSDDEGETWTENPLGCSIGAMDDHQSVGGGPYSGGSRPADAIGTPTTYPDTVYYCAQNGDGNCGVSHDGGLTYTPSVLAYSSSECQNFHGHLKTATDGTTYLPAVSCTEPNAAFGPDDRVQAVVVTTDNGETWQIKRVPGSSSQFESDPSVGVGSDGTVYFAYASDERIKAKRAATSPFAFTSGDEPAANDTGDSVVEVVVSTNRGDTWTAPVELGRDHGLRNVQFPSVVAGDGDRAAVMYVGSTESGNDQLFPTHNAQGVMTKLGYTGDWHVYVSTTLDRGLTWQTVQVTDQPMQRGCISLGGLQANPNAPSCRNLLDFNDVAVDAKGRIAAVYADGCTGVCKTSADPDDNPRDAIVRVALQTSGPLLYAADSEPVIPEVPLVAVLPVAAVAMMGYVVFRRRRLTV